MSSRFAVAVHTLTLMAWAGDEPLKSEQIAASVKTNPVVIRRILCALAQAGLVTSQTGATGGSRLACKPARITLLAVHRAVEEKGVFALHRRPPSRQCPVGGNIESVLDDIFEHGNKAVEHVLSKITIKNVLQNTRSSSGTAKKS